MTAISTPAWPVPQRGAKRMSAPWKDGLLPGLSCCSHQCRHTKDAQEQINDGINKHTNANSNTRSFSLGPLHAPFASCSVFFTAACVLELKCLCPFPMPSPGLSLPWAGVCPGQRLGPGTFNEGLSIVGCLNEHIHMWFVSVCLLPFPLVRP